MSSSLRGHRWENWEWDPESKSPDAHLSPCRQVVYFHVSHLLDSHGTAGARGTKGFSYGEHYWEIVFLEPPFGNSVMVGIGTRDALLHTGDQTFINLIGMDSESWGLTYKGFIWHNGRSRKYTDPFYESNTVIGLLLDLTGGTLTFFRNGQNLGVAFTGLEKIGTPLFPLVSSTAPETELELGLRTQKLCSLQERCIDTSVNLAPHPTPKNAKIVAFVCASFVLVCAAKSFVFAFFFFRYKKIFYRSSKVTQPPR